jgi:hypothetical protein
MAVVNALAYYITATITTAKSFIELALGVRDYDKKDYIALAPRGANVIKYCRNFML